MDTTWRLEVESADKTVCETCGPAYEYIEVTRTNGKYDATVAVGCYGGEHLVTTSLAEITAFLRDWDHLDLAGVAGMRESITREADPPACSYCTKPPMLAEDIDGNPICIECQDHPYLVSRLSAVEALSWELDPSTGRAIRAVLAAATKEDR